jgi:hypothetical protein
METIYPGDMVDVTLVARVNGFAMPPGNINTAIVSSGHSSDKMYNNIATFVVWTQ